MILLAGGTGLLGTRVAARLATAGRPIRVLTREARRAGHLAGSTVDIVEGDVRDQAAVRRAMSGASVIVSAVQGFGGPDADGVRAVDGDGNHNLIAEAVAAGVEQFVLVSIQGASAEHPMELFRVKYGTEQRLTSSTLDWTIIRPTAFMQTWLTLLASTTPIRIFGRGENPINFVCAGDVASVVALAVTDPRMRGETVDVAGPENLTFNQFAHIVQEARGQAGPVRHVPRPMMRAAAVMLRPMRPTLAAQIAAGVVMDTYPMACDPAALTQRWPDLRRTTLAELTAPSGR
jgi:uncharacterized protein YbjT (DUF2867 family)